MKRQLMGVARVLAFEGVMGWVCASLQKCSSSVMADDAGAYTAAPYGQQGRRLTPNTTMSGQRRCQPP